LSPSTSRRTALKARINLFAACTHCYWCGILTLWPTSPQSALGILDDDHATLDHLLHVRDRSLGCPQPVVLACFACNQLRARLNSYAAKAWPLTSAQCTLLAACRAAYAQRLTATLNSGLLAPGSTQLAAEYATAHTNLLATTAILSSSAVPSNEITLLRSRLAAQLAVPAYLIA
jgi:hypothetical protein